MQAAGRGVVCVLSSLHARQTCDQMVLIQEQLPVRSQLAAALFIGQKKNVAWKADGHVNGELEILDGLLHKLAFRLPPPLAQCRGSQVC
jgi:hypothetical protein